VTTEQELNRAAETSVVVGVDAVDVLGAEVAADVLGLAGAAALEAGGALDDVDEVEPQPADAIAAEAASTVNPVKWRLITSRSLRARPRFASGTTPDVWRRGRGVFRRSAPRPRPIYGRMCRA
jgi:hypothetical protein